MMTGFSRTAVKWILSLWLTGALALAPAAVALADCLPGPAPKHDAMAQAEKAPCDMPCKHCQSDDEQQQCANHCVGATVSIIVASDAFAPPASTMRLAPQRYSSPTAFARPPDTPPPRSPSV